MAEIEFESEQRDISPEQLKEEFEKRVFEVRQHARILRNKALEANWELKLRPRFPEKPLEFTGYATPHAQIHLISGSTFIGVSENSGQTIIQYKITDHERYPLEWQGLLFSEHGVFEDNYIRQMTSLINPPAGGIPRLNFYDKVLGDFQKILLGTK